MVLQEKMEAVEEGLAGGHLRILRFLLPTFQEALISWDLWETSTHPLVNKTSLREEELVCFL